MSIDFGEMNQDVESWVKALREVGEAYKRDFGRSLSLTGGLGELYACKHMELKRAPEGQANYDAEDKDNLRVQIKSRAPHKLGVESVDPKGTVGRFHTWDFDYALLVLLDADLNLDGIWQCEKASVKQLQGNPRNPRRGISVKKFTDNAQKVYSSPL